MFTGFVLCVSEFVLAIMECNLERIKQVVLICIVQLLKALLGSKCLVEVETVYHICYTLKTHPTLPHVVSILSLLLIVSLATSGPCSL